jgi:sulfate permease, SulP family
VAEAIGTTEAKPGRSPLITPGDAFAGVSIALLLIPQSLAYARIAGVPGHIGLYAAALPPIAASFFASSPYVQTGPVAVTALLTAGVLAGLAPVDTPRYIALAAGLALMVGLMRLAIGLLRMGRVVYMMSEPVLRGFTSGAALIILFSQVPALVGVHESQAPLRSFVDLFLQWRLWDMETLAISAVTFAIIIGSRKIHPLIPWAVIVTVGGILYSRVHGYDGAIVGNVPEGFFPLTLDLPWRSMPDLLLPGLVIALVGFAEVASIARTFAARERQHWEPDRDFISQGAANLAAAVSGGMPVGGSFSRSGLGHMLGVRTPRSGLVTGLTVLLFLPFASVLSPLPAAVLSALVVAGVVPLIRIRPILNMWSLSRPQFLVAASTLLLTLTLAPRVDQAVIIGVLVAVAVHLWREFDLKVVSWVEHDELHVRPEGVLWFGSAEMLQQDVLELVAENPQAARLVLHMQRVGRVDLTASLALEALIEQAQEAGIEPEIRQAHPITAKALHRVLTRPRRPAVRRSR